MSYCRFDDDSDLYVFYDGTYFQCCGCCILAGDTCTFGTLAELKHHLDEHVKRGDKVPDYAIDRVKFEMAKGTTVYGQPLDPTQISPPEWN